MVRGTGWFVGLILAIVTISGCAARGGSAAPPPESWVLAVEGVFAGSRDEVWKAVIVSLDGFKLEQRDPLAGTAVTGWKKTLEYRDALAVLRPRRTEDMNDPRDPKPPYLRINFEVKRRLVIGLTEVGEGKTRVSLTRHLFVTCFDSPAGANDNDTFQTLVREEFDREDELRAILGEVRKNLGE